MRICVFAASSDAIKEEYKTAAFQLGVALAQKGHTLVFGGGKSGLMGAIAKGFAQEKGYIIGVTPKIFDSEEFLFPLDEKIVTNSLVDRKQKMVELADGFVCLPGGIGTYDELFEVLSARQLNYHQKPMILYNTLGYYDALIDFLDQTFEKGFMDEQSLSIYSVCNCPEMVVNRLK